MFSLNFMFFCSLIEELCTKEENYKTSCNFNFGHECMIECIYKYKRVASTHKLNKALAIVWKTGTRILMYKLILRPWPSLKRGFEKLPPPPTPPRGVDVKEHISEHNSAPNYLMMKKLHVERLEIKTEKQFRWFWNSRF